jgi:hypothetical protein
LISSPTDGILRAFKGGSTMGLGDNRRSPKMRRKVAQKKYKARLKRRRETASAAKAKPAAAPAKAKPAASTKKKSS